METTQGNQVSWNANAYQTWLNRFGQPEEAAARIKKDPAKRIRELLNMQGILHYFQEMGPLFDVVFRLLAQGGRLILQDFHPVSTKLISSRGKGFM
ncbi:hypothetical protein [Paenibacillus thiaminolyticus]|uniref:hypothetical protein n=1 Tax=Paenibacillus thiaminolyticus TaxID=49283 RepID=UPI002175B123|nr:hypothetical protein [Paenibacillus thiaminolyticus]